jgi:tRNA (uracil-5-)-methyltransferase
MPAADALNDQVTPFWRKTYSEQLAAKQASMADALVKISRSLADPVPGWALRNRKMYNGMVCPLADVLPSPVECDYRNKCEFTFGHDPDGQLVAGFLLGAWHDGVLTVLPPTACLHVPAQAKTLCAAFQVSPLLFFFFLCRCVWEA